MRQILKSGPADLDWIQSQGLLAVKLAQIFALRSDLIPVEKCRQLQQLYQHAASIPAEDVFNSIEEGRSKQMDDVRFFKDDAKDLIFQMLQLDATRRITAAKAMEHPWLEQIHEGGNDKEREREER